MDEYYPDVDTVYEDCVSGYVDWDFDCDFPECPYGENGDSSEETE